MSKKLTYNYVKEQIEKTGYKLLSKEYKNNHTKLEVHCPKKHVYKVTWANFQQESRCPMCSNKTCADKRKLTYKYVKSKIEKKDYKLLSKEYKNSRSKLKLQCSMGHEFKIRWDKFQQGAKCPTCYRESLKLAYGYIKKQIEKKGYKFLSEDYKNNYTKLQIQCSKGHKFKMRWGNFQQGRECPICSINKKRHTYEYIKEQVEKEGYKLLNKEYINSYTTKLDFQCPIGHKFKMKWNNFQQGQKCPICNIDKKKLRYEYVKEQINKKGYELLSKKYINNCTKLKIQCSKGHKFRMDWNRFQRSQKCPICQVNSFASKAEREIANIIEVQGIKIKRNDRTQIINPLTGNKLELDIFMPDFSKAIEYNGIYWHSFGDKIIKDKIKLRECAKKGIKLLVIKEQDWIDNKINCINKIKTFVKNEPLLPHLETS